MEKNENNLKSLNIQGLSVSQPAFSATQTTKEATSALLFVFQGKSLAWIVLLSSLVVTFFAWYLARDTVLQRANDRFIFRCQTIELALRDRLHASAFLLQSGTGLFAGSEEVTRAEWQTYVTALQIDKHYQGVQGLGFSKRIPAAEKSTHIHQIRDEGFPNYDIHPDGERPEYTSAVFLEPFDWQNQRAFGYDMFSEATRREAMEMARDTGSAALSGRVTLSQETEKDIQAGFLMYQPVYRNGEVVEPLEQRREALMGYVYSPFRMNDFMRGLLKGKQEDVELQVFDGDEPLKEALLYPSGNLESLISNSGHAHFATYQSILEYGSRHWLLVFTPSPYFEETIDTNQVNSILLPGIAIDLLLFYVLLSLTRSRNQALSLANMTVDLEKANFGLKREIEERKQAAQHLEEAELRFKTVFNAAIDGILVADAKTRKFVMGNNAICDMLGYQLEELIRLGIEDIHPAASFPEVQQQVERQAKGEIRLAPDLPVERKDGSVFYADVNTTTMVLAGRPMLVGVFHDVTKRKQGEEKIRKLNDELEEKVLARTQQLLDTQEKLKASVAETRQALEYANTLTRSSPDGIIAVDLDLRITEWNLLMEQMCGQVRDQLIGQDLADIPFMMETGEGARIREALEGKSIGPREVAYRIPGENSERFFESIMAPLHESTGQILGAVLRVRDITERKRMANDLIESERRLRTIFESVQAGIAIIDPEKRRIVDVNSFAARMIGAPKENIVGAECHKFICPAERGKCPFTDLHQTIDNSERALLTDAGERREIIKTITTIQLGGRPHLLESFIDITERKQAEQALRQSKHFLDTLLNAMPLPVFYKDREGRYLGFNKAFEAFFGATRDQLIGKSVFDISPPELAKIYHAKDTELYESNGIQQYEASVKNAQGLLREVIFNKAVFTDSQGEVSGLIGAILDITDRRRAEEQQRQALLYARSLIEADMDPLMTINVEGVVMDVNKAAIQMTGVPRELMTGSDFSRYFTEPDRALSGYKEAFEKGFVRDYPLTMKHASGALTEVLYNASVYRNEKGEMAGVLAVVRDISERLRAEQAEEEARRDGLTGLYNHRTFHTLLKDEMSRTQRFNHQLSLLMLDIDYFKQVNDSYGHQAGDTILKNISKLLVEQARDIDRVCRYGGEEITLILPETVTPLAMKIAERLRAAVKLQSFDISDGKTIDISVSIGVATYPLQADSPEALVKAADLALYAAKQAGRNRVCCYDTEMGA